MDSYALEIQSVRNMEYDFGFRVESQTLHLEICSVKNEIIQILPPEDGW